MKTIAMVTSDETKPWEMGADKGISRTLTLIDQDGEHRMIPSFQCKIQVDDPVAGDGKGGADLKDCVIELAVTDINQREHNKRLVFVGKVVKILGRMAMEPFDATKRIESGQLAGQVIASKTK